MGRYGRYPINTTEEAFDFITQVFSNNVIKITHKMTQEEEEAERWTYKWYPKILDESFWWE